MSEADLAQLEVEDQRRLVRHREAYTHRLFYLMVGWIGIVLLLLALTGVHFPDAEPTFVGSWAWWAWGIVITLLVLVLLGLIWPRTTSKDSQRSVATKKWWWIYGFACVGVLGASALGAFLGSRPTAKGSAVSPSWSILDWMAAFHLSDAVLLALIGGTTANVIFLFVVVARHLFPKHDGRPRNGN